MNYLTAGGITMLVFGLGALIRFLLIKDIAGTGLEPAAGAVILLFGIGLLVKGQQQKD